MVIRLFRKGLYEQLKFSPSTIKVKVNSSSGFDEMVKKLIKTQGFGGSCEVEANGSKQERIDRPLIDRSLNSKIISFTSVK